MKEKIIHWLGGYTNEECADLICEGFKDGYKRCAVAVKDYADSLYGKEGDDWYHTLYEKIVDIVEESV